MTHDLCHIFRALRIPAHDAFAESKKPIIRGFLNGYFGTEEWKTRAFADFPPGVRSYIRAVLNVSPDNFFVSPDCLSFLYRTLELHPRPAPAVGEKVLRFLAQKGVYNGWSGRASGWTVNNEDWPEEVWVGVREILGVPQPKKLFVFLTDNLVVRAKVAETLDAAKAALDKPDDSPWVLIATIPEKDL